ncbi:MAG: ankyrin repeat domain-containing protein [Clostridia bacterium]|nr:ankyrin repeat domain-containing protein [Clostridia bacterium]
MLGFDKIIAQIAEKSGIERRSNNKECYIDLDVPVEYTKANPYDRRKMYVETVDGKLSVIAMQKFAESRRFVFATDSTMIQFFDKLATDYTSVSDAERLSRVHGCATFIFRTLLEGFKGKYDIDKEVLFDAMLRLKNKCDNVKGYEFSNVINGKNSLNYLVEAMKYGGDDVVRFMVEKLGANVNRKAVDADNSELPLYYACDRGNMELVAYLISKGAKPTPECGLYAAKTLNVRMMSQLVRGGLDVNNPALLDVVLDIAKKQKKNVQSIGANVGEMLDFLVEAGAKTEKEVAAEGKPVRKKVAILKKNVLVKMTHNYIKKSEERERRQLEERYK